MSRNPKRRERFQKVGSINYEGDKKKLMARSRQGLFLTMEAITAQLEAGKPLRDEQIRFMKNFSSTLAALEMREQDLESREETGLPEGRLKEFVEHQFKFMDATGLTNPREDGLSVMERAGYMLCEFCGEFHKAPDPCPFENVAKERLLHKLVLGKEERLKDPNGPVDLSGQ